MTILSILFFFVVTFGLGYALTSFVRESENFLERNLMRIGIGFGAFITLGLLLNLLSIPLDWKIFLSASTLLILILAFKNRRHFSFKPSFKLTKTNLVILLMLIIFFATFYMYAKGAFSYPWLEDDDPWAHAIGVKYVAVEKTVFTEQRIKYVDPYPPSYDMVLGVLHQTNDSVYWTLKFFNALFISLSIIFFFFFAKELSDTNKALFSAFALAAVPAYLSHFIWAISLTVPLYFVSFYCIERIKHDKKWFIVAAVAIGATLTSSPSHSTYFALLLIIYYFVRVLIEKSILIYYAAAGFLGLLVSFFLWWLPSIMRRGIDGTIRGIGAGGSKITGIAGTGDKVYTLQDFFIAKTTNAINNPIGIGLVLSFLLLISLIALVYRYYDYIKKYKLLVFGLFSVLSLIVLIFLKQTYVKNITNITTGYAAPLEPGSVPFLEMVADQYLLVFGLIIMIFVFALILAVSYKNTDFKEKYILIALAWLIFAFYAVNAGPFQYKLSPFRAWSVFVIPLAILVSDGLFFLMSFLEKLMVSKSIVIVVIIAGIVLTSAYQKYTVNTSQWPPGAFWSSQGEFEGYLWLKDNIEPNTKIFTFIIDGPLIGMDKYICNWCEDLKEFKKIGINKSASEISSFLSTRGYKHLIIDGQFVNKFGMNETNNKLNELLESGLFKPVHATNGFILLQVG